MLQLSSVKKGIFFHSKCVAGENNNVLIFFLLTCQKIQYPGIQASSSVFYVVRS